MLAILENNKARWSRCKDLLQVGATQLFSKIAASLWVVVKIRNCFVASPRGIDIPSRRRFLHLRIFTYNASEIYMERGGSHAH